MRCGIRKSTVRSSDEGVYLQPGVHGARTRYAGTARRSEYVRFTVVSSLYRTVRFSVVELPSVCTVALFLLRVVAYLPLPGSPPCAQTTAHRPLLAC